jgi:AcrR family transcriptional regulator
MTNPVKPKAADYKRRRVRAQATRARVLDAARVLFIDRGYVATTVDSIAKLADVAPETIYSTFGTKRSLLAEVVDVTIAGDVVAAPVLEQGWVQEMRSEPDAHRRLAILASNGAAILARRAAIDAVVWAAAASDPDIAALRDSGKAQRMAGQRHLLRIVAGTTGLRDGLDADTAAGTLYAIGSPETFRLLVAERGWSAARFVRWYAETLERLLLDPRTDADG